MNRQIFRILLATTAIWGCDTPAHEPGPAPDNSSAVQRADNPPEEPEAEETESTAQGVELAQLVPQSDSVAGEDQVAEPQVVERKLAIKGPKATDEALGFAGLGLHGTGRGGGGIGLGKGTVGYGRGSGGVASGQIRGSAIRSVGSPPRTPTFQPRTNTERYTDHGTNRFTDTSEDHLSTFAIDVDTGSYTIARRKLNEGGTPPKASVRVEEFLNYFGYDYPKPTSGAFSVSMEAAPSPFATDGKTQLLRVGVQGKTIRAEERRPVHLTFLVDVSGSMRSGDKIRLVKKSLQILTDNLKEGDTVAIATYAGRTEVLLEPTRARGKIFDAIEQLSAGGSTAMASGLDLAYGLAAKNLKAEHENRVIVLSDGDANVGRTGWKAMLNQISNQVKKGITLSTIGFGMGNYQDATMEQLANHGDGNYFYIDSEKEAAKVFGDQIDGTLQVIAKDVKIQVDFNPEAVRRYRLIGYENRDIADKDFRNDKVDAGEIGAGHTVTALYEIELQDEVPELLATVRVRHKEPHGSDKASEQAFTLKRDELHRSIGASSADFQFAAAVAAFAEKLRQSPYAEKLTYDWILEVAEGAAGRKADRREFVKLVKKAQRA